MSGLFLWPLLQHFTTHLPSRADGAFISFTIDWVARSLASGTSVFNAPIFHPYPSTLAYSDPFLSTGLLTLLILPFTSNLVIIHNLHVVIGTVVLFSGFYVLALTIAKSRLAALFGATFFTFSNVHLLYIVHLHTYLLAGLPWCLYGWLEWQRKGEKKYLALASVAFLYQALNAPMTGFFTVACLAATLINKKILKNSFKQWKVVAGLGITTLLICVLFYLPYFQVSQHFNYTRSIRDAAHFSHGLTTFFNTELLLIYSLIAVCFLTARKIKPHSSVFFSMRSALLVCAIGGILMLGPVLKITNQTFKVFSWPIPLPYAVLYYVIPGFNAFRTSSRWIVVFNVGLSLVLAMVIKKSYLRQRMLWLLYLGLVIFLLHQHLSRFPLFAVPSTAPPIYQEVARLPPTVVADFPVYSWRMLEYSYHENDRLLYQRQHGQTLYNGASGFTPPERELEMDWLWQHFPDQESIQRLSDLGVTKLVVHFDQYQAMSDNDYTYAGVFAPTPTLLKERLAAQPRLVLLKCLEAACLYTIPTNEP